ITCILIKTRQAGPHLPVIIYQSLPVVYYWSLNLFLAPFQLHVQDMENDFDGPDQIQPWEPKARPQRGIREKKGSHGHRPRLFPSPGAPGATSTHFGPYP